MGNNHQPCSPLVNSGYVSPQVKRKLEEQRYYSKKYGENIRKATRTF